MSFWDCARDYPPFGRMIPVGETLQDDAKPVAPSARRILFFGAPVSEPRRPEEQKNPRLHRGFCVVLAERAGNEPKAPICSKSII